MVMKNKKLHQEADKAFFTITVILFSQLKHVSWLLTSSGFDLVLNQ